MYAPNMKNITGQNLMLSAKFCFALYMALTINTSMTYVKAKYLNLFNNFKICSLLCLKFVTIRLKNGHRLITCLFSLISLYFQIYFCQSNFKFSNIL